MTLNQLLAQFPNGFFDWIYVDADHRYEAVARDATVAARKLKPGGTLVFNDYTMWSPIEGIPYGVPQVVHELCLADGWEFVYLALDPQGYFDVAIRRIESA